MSDRRLRLGCFAACVFALTCAALGQAAAPAPAVPVLPPGPAAAPAPKPAPTAPAPADGRAIEEDGTGTHIAYLQSDGNLAGRVSAFDADGVRRPIRIRIWMIRNNQVVASARSDEWGRFQMVGLGTGVYTVVTRGPAGFAVDAVHVRPNSALKPNQAGGPDGKIQLASFSQPAPIGGLLDIVVGPSSVAEILSQLNEADITGAAAPAGATPPTAAAGGGGGSGMEALLGLGALGAGLAGGGLGGGAGAGAIGAGGGIGTGPGGTGSTFAPQTTTAAPGLAGENGGTITVVPSGSLQTAPPPKK